MDFETSQLPFAYLAIYAMTEILKQKYEIWGYYPTKIAITFKDYKDSGEEVGTNQWQKNWIPFAQP